jgi:hypothetical protein
MPTPDFSCMRSATYVAAAIPTLHGTIENWSPARALRTNIGCDPGPQEKNVLTSKRSTFKKKYLLNGGSEEFLNNLAIHKEGLRHPSSLFACPLKEFFFIIF